MNDFKEVETDPKCLENRVMDSYVNVVYIHFLTSTFRLIY